MVPQEFAEQVRDLLMHLFDPVRLQHHPLMAVLVPGDGADPWAKAQALRDIVLQAIAALKPPSGTPPSDPAYRPYAIARQRYADGFSREEVQRSLAISRRQFFRDQQRALEAITSLLWEWRVREPKAGADGMQALADDLEQVGLQVRAFPLADTARRAIATVRSLADRRGVALSLGGEEAVQAFSDEAITRQAIVCTLSVLVQNYVDRSLEMSLKSDGTRVALLFWGIRANIDEDELEQRLFTARRLATRINASLRIVRSDDGLYLVLSLPLSREKMVVIIDDNPNTLRLLQRYLEPYHYRPVLVSESEQALALISELQPDAVILDIMMQNIDGWQILQSLKTDPRTTSIPVIVCSVLNEGELASTLGAEACLRKPVSQMALVRALAQVRRA
ncbi:MAG: response regulator [Anaerolineae bacterium]